MADLGLGLDRFLPDRPKVGKTDKETIANLYKAFADLLDGFQELSDMMRTQAQTGFTSMTEDGGSTYTYAIDTNGVLEVTGGSGTVDFDMPLVNGANFTVNGSGYIEWDSCTVTYQGTVYNISGTSHNPVGMDAVIYWNASDKTHFYGKPADSAINSGDWYLAYYQHIGTSVFPTFQSFIINGALIQANTVTATQIDVDNVFAQDIEFTNAIHTVDKTSYSDTDNGIWMGIDSSTAKVNIGGSSEYVKWDGSNVNIVCSGGKIGSSTDYYDITEGLLQVKESGMDYYMITSGASLVFRSYAYGGTPGITYCAVGVTGLTSMCNNASGNFAEIILQTTTADKFKTKLTHNGVDYDFYFGVYSLTNNNYILIDSATTTYEISKIDLKGCVITTDANATDGALKWDSSANKLQVYNGSTSLWETVSSS